VKRLSADTTYKLPQLSEYVDSVNFFNNAHHSDSKNILFDASPEGVFELIFQSDDAVWQKDNNEKIWKQREEAFVGGLHQQSYQIKLPPETEIISVRFRPGAFKYVFSGPLNEFVNAKVPVIDLWQSQGLQLKDKLRKLNDHHDKIKVIAAFIAANLNEKKHSVIDDSVNEIICKKGIVDISSLEHDSHLSTAQFRKRFREEVGLSPKKYAKIIKVNAILSELGNFDGGQHLTDLVYAYDYFDQSHFIKDFKSIVGKTPTQYFTAKV
jgi:AraC-like DNA-binding protein